MMILSIFLGIVAIGFCCWLLFTLAIFALPAIAGVTIGLWEYHAGAGVAGGVAVAAIAAFLMLVVLQAGLMFARPLWLRAALALAFVVPAAIAGFHATHGIIKHTVPSPAWQFVFSLIGSLAVGITAYTRLTALAAAAAQGQSIVRCLTRPSAEAAFGRRPYRYRATSVSLDCITGRTAGMTMAGFEVAPHRAGPNG